jgi:hypothetical protein
MTLLLGLLLLVGPIVVLLGAWLMDAMQLVRRLTGRGEIADVANEETRALIDGDGEAYCTDRPLPVAEATRINAAFAGLINSDLRELRRVDEDLARFYVNGDER